MLGPDVGQEDEQIWIRSWAVSAIEADLLIVAYSPIISYHLDSLLRESILWFWSRAGYW